MKTKVTLKFYKQVIEFLVSCVTVHHDQVVRFFAKGSLIEEAIHILYMNDKITISKDGLISWTFAE